MFAPCIIDRKGNACCMETPLHSIVGGNNVAYALEVFKLNLPKELVLKIVEYVLYRSEYGVLCQVCDSHEFNICCEFCGKIKMKKGNCLRNCDYDEYDVYDIRGLGKCNLCEDCKIDYDILFSNGLVNMITKESDLHLEVNDEWYNEVLVKKYNW